MEHVAIDWGQAGALVPVGLLVVFLVLVILIALVFLFGKILGGISTAMAEKRRRDNLRQTAEPVHTHAAVPDAPQTEERPAETVAAIAAAVAVMTGGKPHKIRSIRRVKETRSAWRAAGIADNTRAF